MEALLEGRGIDPRYRGIFLMLHISALVFAVIFIFVGAVPLYGIYIDLPALQISRGWIANPTLETVIRIGLPAMLLVTGTCLLFAGGFGLVGWRLGRDMLFFASVLMIADSVALFAMAVQKPMSMYGWVSLPWEQVLPFVEAALHSFAYPALCIVAIQLVERKKAKRPLPDEGASKLISLPVARSYQSPFADNRTSPWRPLAKTVAIIGFLGGLISIADSLYLMREQLKIFPTLTSTTWLLTLASVTGILLILIGAILILFNNWIGRILLLSGIAWRTIGLLYVLYASYSFNVLAGTQNWADLADWAVYFMPLSVYALFAFIVLLVPRNLFQKSPK